MRFAAARHGRKKRARSRRTALGLALCTAMAGLPVLTATSPASAVADCALTPELSHVMVNQGLPSYKEFAGDGRLENKLVRGKTTLVKYFLRLPGCAPEATDVRVVGGQLFTSISPAKIDSSGRLVPPTSSDVLAVTGPSGPLPAPPVGPTATAPVAEAASDPLFVVPGSALRPSSPEEKRIYFAAVLQYTVNGGAAQTLNLLAAPGTGELVSRVVDRDVRPLRVLVVPMGNAGTERAPKTYLSQFPDAARVELERGTKALSRILPVPDYAGEDLFAGNSGLRTGLSAGLLTLGAHVENGKTVDYMANDTAYCGSFDHFGYIAGELQKRRTAHNSVNDKHQAEFAYGAIWQDRSLGSTTGTTDPACLEGAGSVPGRAAWGRLVAPVAGGRAGVSGTIAAMELTHNAGRVSSGDTRFRTGFHSINRQADVTAPDRAWNTLDHRWVSQDRSVMSDDFGGWNDSNALLEAQDWDGFHCLLTSSTCSTGATIGVGAAGGPTGTFYLSGSFSGLDDADPANDQVDVASYRLQGGHTEPPASDSPYVLVQRKGDSPPLRTDRIPVSSAVDAHQHGGSSKAHPAEVFGVQLPAAADVDRIQIYRGSQVLYERVFEDAPTFLSASVAGRTASVSATGQTPENLRLDVFLSCPGAMTAPLSVDLSPVVVGRVAAFTTTYDTSLGCGDAGKLLYRLNNGFSTRTDTDLTDIADDVALDGVAAIHSPTAGAKVTQFAAIPLAGAGRDGAGLPADRFEWRLAPTDAELPEQPTATGDTGSAPAPKTGWLAGRSYTVQLRTFRSGVEIARASSLVTILPDEDGDTLPDPVEPPCVPGSVGDGRNATRDSDQDGAADVVDVVDVNGDGLIDVLQEYETCTRRSSGEATFDPRKLQKGSSGVPVTVRIRSSEIDLLQLKASGAQLFVHQVAGYRARIAADSWSVVLTVTGPVAEVKFSRDELNRVLQAHGILGYAPIFVGTADRRLFAADPASPVVFP